MIDHQDFLNSLNKDIPIKEKLGYVHSILGERFDFIDRIAVMIHDPKTDTLSSYLHSTQNDRRTEHYMIEMSRVPVLLEILEQGRPRIIPNLKIFTADKTSHRRRAGDNGYRESYTMPMFLNGNFFGFVFFNSVSPDPFSSEALHYLDLFGHLISLVVVNEVSSIRTLVAAIKTVRDVTHHRDVETGAHLDRIALYSKLIARDMADEYGFEDEYIEHVFLFASLHDIGKIGIPDSILLKPGKLSADEYHQMKRHVEKGRQIIDEMIHNFGLESLQRIDVLRNIAQYHHEAVDGSGYPDGLVGENIPIEARIVSAADVFDALTSKRPYREPVSNDEAFVRLRSISGVTLEERCVQALEQNRQEVEKIQEQFAENCYG